MDDQEQTPREEKSKRTGGLKRLVVRPCHWLFSLAVIVALATPALSAVTANRDVTYASLLDHRHMAFRCSGKGDITILFESGFGGDSRGWAKVQNLLDQRYVACAYDRAGNGVSDPGPLPRDANAVAQDLHQSVLALHIQGPLILVGHSSGGLYVRRYAELFPDQIIGLVLVDPSVEFQNRRFELRFGAGAGGVGPIVAQQLKCLKAAQALSLPSKDPALARCTPTPSEGPDAARLLKVAIDPKAIEDKISELATLWTTTSDQVAGGKLAIANIPTIVLTASDTYARLNGDARSAVDELWWSLHSEITQGEAKGQHRLVPGSSHLIMLDKPQSIANAVQDLTPHLQNKR